MKLAGNRRHTEQKTQVFDSKSRIAFHFFLCVRKERKGKEEKRAGEKVGVGRRNV